MSTTRTTRLTAAADRVLAIEGMSSIANVSDDEIVASIERLIGRRIPTTARASVLSRIDRMADAIVASITPKRRRTGEGRR
jgi:hypothetical protein